MKKLLLALLMSLFMVNTVFTATTVSITPLLNFTTDVLRIQNTNNNNLAAAINHHATTLKGEHGTGVILNALAADVSYYINPGSGLDYNSGAAANPFKTIQHAIDIIPKNLNGYTAYIYLTPSLLYSESISIADFDSGELRIISNPVDVSSVLITAPLDNDVFTISNSKAAIIIKYISMRVITDDYSCFDVEHSNAFIGICKVSDNDNTGTMGIYAYGDSNVRADTVTDYDVKKVAIGLYTQELGIIHDYNSTAGDTLKTVYKGGIITDAIILNKADYDSAVSLKHNSNHNLLSAPHEDTTTAAAVRGDIIIGSGVSPLWTRLAVGAATTYLQGGTEPSWATLNQAAVAGLTTADSPTLAGLTLSGVDYGYDLKSSSIDNVEVFKRVSIVDNKYLGICSNKEGGVDGEGGAHINLYSDGTGVVNSGQIQYNAFGQGSGANANSHIFSVRTGVNTATEKARISSAGLLLSNLTSSLPVVSDANKNLASLAYTGATSLRKNLGLETDDSPTFAGATIGSLAGIIKGSAGVLSALALGAANTKLFVNEAGNAPEFAAGIKTGLITRDTAAADAAIAETGVGFRPSHVIFLAVINGTPQASVGFDNGTNRYSFVNTYNVTADTWSSDELMSIQLWQTDTIHCEAYISAFGADGFTLSWGKVGAKTGTAKVIYMAFR